MSALLIVRRCQAIEIHLLTYLGQMLSSRPLRLCANIFSLWPEMKGCVIIGVAVVTNWPRVRIPSTTSTLWFSNLNLNCNVKRTKVNKKLPGLGHFYTKNCNKVIYLGSSCGSVGKAVASDTRCPQFKSSQHLYWPFTYCQLDWKRRKKGKGADNGSFEKTLFC